MINLRLFVFVSFTVWPACGVMDHASLHIRPMQMKSNWTQWIVVSVKPIMPTYSLHFRVKTFHLFQPNFILVFYFTFVPLLYCCRLCTWHENFRTKRFQFSVNMQRLRQLRSHSKPQWTILLCGQRWICGDRLFGCKISRWIGLQSVLVLCGKKSNMFEMIAMRWCR